MLFVQGLGAPTSELTTLKKHVDQCLRWMPITGSDDSAASEAVTCAGWIGGDGSGMGEGIRAFEKVTLLDDADNALLFDIAVTLLTSWRNTDMGPSKSRSEDNVRRIAAQKLGEESVYRFSPTHAAQTLSSNGRQETTNTVKLAIVNSLYQILKTQNIPDSVRAEALTTLRRLADIDDYPHTSLDVINAAKSAVRDLGLKLEIGPITVMPVSKPRSPYLIPIVATVTTAALATGALVFMFRRRSEGHALRGAGPLRRKAEAALRRRQGR